MNLDRVIAVRTQKTVYKDGEESVKVFGGEYSAATFKRGALSCARGGSGNPRARSACGGKDGRQMGDRNGIH